MTRCGWGRRCHAVWSVMELLRKHRNKLFLAAFTAAGIECTEIDLYNYVNII